MSQTRGYIIWPAVSLWPHLSFSPLFTMASWLFFGDAGQVSASRPFHVSIYSLWVGYSFLNSSLDWLFHSGPSFRWPILRKVSLPCKQTATFITLYLLIRLYFSSYYLFLYFKCFISPTNTCPLLSGTLSAHRFYYCT